MSPRIPASLRRPIPHPEVVVPALLVDRLRDTEIGEAAQTIGAILAHQERLLSEGVRTYKGELLKVEIVDREHGGKVLGRKAEVTVLTQSKDRKNGEWREVEESIATDWTSGGTGESWETLVARSIVDDAREAIGQTVELTKITVGEGDSRFRTLIDLQVVSS